MVKVHELVGHIVKPRSSWETSLHEFNQVTFHALVPIS